MEEALSKRPEFTIDALYNVGPFVPYSYNNTYEIYYLESCVDKMGNRNRAFIYRNDDGKIKVYVLDPGDAGESCLGRFFKKMNKEEQELFIQNYEAIFCALNINKEVKTCQHD